MHAKHVEEPTRDECGRPLDQAIAALDERRRGVVPLDGVEHGRLFPRAQDGTRDVHPASVFVVHDDLRQPIGITERHRP